MPRSYNSQKMSIRKLSLSRLRNRTEVTESPCHVTEERVERKQLTSHVNKHKNRVTSKRQHPSHRARMTEKGSPQQLLAGREIPNRRIADISNIPSDYSTTPGGSIFSTTPGGSRIFYDRSFLLQCRNSPLTKTPPQMANIPGVTSPGEIDVPKENGVEEAPKPAKRGGKGTEDNPQFEMDI